MRTKQRITQDFDFSRLLRVGGAPFAVKGMGFVQAGAGGSPKI